MEIKKIKELKKGEFFRRLSPSGLIGSTIYVKDYYERSSKKYYAYDYFDINYFRAFRPDQDVVVDFEF